METRKLRETHRRRIKRTEIMLDLTAAARLRPSDKVRDTSIRTHLKVKKKRLRDNRERKNETHLGLHRGWRTIELRD